MQLHLKNIRLQIDWLAVLFPCIAAALGEGRMAALLTLSLLAHEAAHLSAARWMHVPIRALRLTPVGGLAQIGNPYIVSAPQLIAVSIAGPAANLALILLSAAFCHWQLFSAALSAELIGINSLLMLFNLLPALPLDGGRILYALLSLILPRRRAVEIGIFIGRILAALRRQRELVVQSGAGQDAFPVIKADFDRMVQGLKAQARQAGEKLSNLFRFCEEVFPDGQELLILVTELTVSPYSAKFISRYGCEEYFAYNKELLFYERQQEIISEIEKLELDDE